MRLTGSCRSWLALIFLAAVPALGFADTPVKRILIVGDSWAATIATVQHDGPGFGSVDAVLAADGLSGYVTQGARTAWGGRTAAQWASFSYCSILTQELQTYPTIDIVHLIIGGNDFLGLAGAGTNIMSYSAAQRSAFWGGIENNIQIIVNHCLAQRTDIKVLISDYDYIDSARAQAFPSSMFNFGGATARQINDALMELGQRKLAIAQRTPRCFYVSNWGVLQHFYNDPAPGLPLPGPAPLYTPYAGGNPDFPMPLAANFGDGIHPTDPAHRYMIQRAVDQFYRAWLTTSGAQPDRDNDGLADRDETRDLDPRVPGYQNPFEPLVADSTGDNGQDTPDGVLDGENDYDGDGQTNAEELAAGSNPLDPAVRISVLTPAGAILLSVLLMRGARKQTAPPKT